MENLIVIHHAFFCELLGSTLAADALIDLIERHLSGSNGDVGRFVAVIDELAEQSAVELRPDFLLLVEHVV